MKFKTSLLAMAVVFSLYGCDSDDDNSSSLQNDATQPGDFTLQVLHFADIDGDTTSALTGNLKAFASILSHFQAEHPDNTLVLSSGDNWIPGPTYTAGDSEQLEPYVHVPAPGRSDVAILNALGVQAAVFGNHEFDQGPGAIAELLSSETDEDDSSRVWPGASFPYLSANLDFSADEDLGPLFVANGQAPQAGRISGSVVIDVNGERVGIIGASTPNMASISSPGSDIVIMPDNGNDTEALAATLQPEIDALTNDGINKIILLGHMQNLEVEKSLASLLSGVDIIIGGGSNTYLGDATDRERDGQGNQGGTYPLQYTSGSDEPVLVVNTDGDLRYLGRLVVNFDAEGRILPAQLDEQINGAYPSDGQGLTDLGLSEATGTIAGISDAISQYIADKEGTTFGSASVFLEGRREFVRSQETNLGNLTADANLWLARQQDSDVAFSLKNGGGIRAPIGQVYAPPGSTGEVELLPTAELTIDGQSVKQAGEISQIDIQTALKFNNGLTIVEATPSQLKDIFENSVFEAGNFRGAFPQIGGIRLEYDITREAGSRVVNLSLDDGTVLVQNGMPVGSQTVKFVTLGYLAGGGDGFPMDTLPQRSLVVEGDRSGSATFADTGTEQDALAEYLLSQYGNTAFAVADTPAAQDQRIVELSGL